MPRIEELLQQLRQGAALADIRVELARLAQSPDALPHRLLAAVQDALKKGQLDQDSANALLNTIANASERTEAKAWPQSGATAARGGAALVDTDPTQLGNPEHTIRSHQPSDATPLFASSPADPTHTEAAPAHASAQDKTLHRPAIADANITAMLITANASLTQRMHRSVETAARTLHVPAGGIEASATQVHASAEPPACAVNQPAPAPAASLHYSALQPGSVIKQRFVLDSLIGKGGMGLVYSAIDRRKEEAQDSSSQVALKILNADLQDHPQSFIALQREARKAQTLAHPNVVTVFDFDRDGNIFYMTMELLRGRSLEAIVQKARGKGISRERALPIIRGIAAGLAYAHRKGIVHSDLKPGNVFITEDDTPKILDFGIARAIPNPASGESADVFDAGSLGAYTEAYATNEMVDGIDPHPADDMYALGIIGYELLTGFHPYQRHSVPAARKLGIKLAPLTGVGQRTARALERCLSFDRDERPRDAGEFLRLLDGASGILKTALAATALLALASGYLWRQNYIENSPAMPFTELPVTVQRQFTELIRQGDEEWRFYERDHNVAALQSAVEQYARAYALHPRNRQAVSGLKRAADALLGVAADTKERHEVAGFLQERSGYFLEYPPVTAAAGK